MKKRHERVYFADMLDRINAIESYIAGVKFEEYARDRMRREAVERNIEPIGKGARQLGREFMDKHPDIPWSDIIGMRNVLIHDYMNIRLRIVWEVATEDLTSLKAWLIEVLGSERDSR